MKPTLASLASLRRDSQAVCDPGMFTFFQGNVLQELLKWEMLSLWCGSHKSPTTTIYPCWCCPSWKCLIFSFFHTPQQQLKGSKALHFISLAAGRAAENPGQGPRDPEMSCLTRGLVEISFFVQPPSESSGEQLLLKPIPRQGRAGAASTI